MCWEKPKVLKYAAGFQLVGNVSAKRSAVVRKLFRFRLCTKLKLIV